MHLDLSIGEILLCGKAIHLPRGVGGRRGRGGVISENFEYLSRAGGRTAIARHPFFCCCPNGGKP